MFPARPFAQALATEVGSFFVEIFSKPRLSVTFSRFFHELWSSMHNPEYSDRMIHQYPIWTIVVKRKANLCKNWRKRGKSGNILERTSILSKPIKTRQANLERRACFVSVAVPVVNDLRPSQTEL